ncbi:MAG: hypothetical protein WCQ47_06615 [bacterium]
MKFIYVCLVITLLAVTGCREVQKDFSNTITATTAGTTDEAKKRCPENAWLQIGNESKCVVCPNKSKINDTQTSCVCDDNSTAYNTYDNVCRKKLSPDQVNFLLQ